MYRSFTDRIFAGVCGGLAGSLPVNAWWLRLAFVVLSLLSGGLFAILYVLLWWILPQESLVTPVKASFLQRIFAILLMLLTIMAWVGASSGWWQAENGQSWLWPAVLVVMAVVLVWRQLGRA
ncbi:MAG: PspC domain-containing protein [Chloroflexi bacterium]|nr:MAG: PspC domain-containing protein [Chloroflexota bacterium]